MRHHILMLIAGMVASCNVLASEVNYNAGADSNSEVTWANCEAAIMRDACSAMEQSLAIAPISISSWSYLFAAGIGLAVAAVRAKRRR